LYTAAATEVPRAAANSGVSCPRPKTPDNIQAKQVIPIRWTIISNSIFSDRGLKEGPAAYVIGVEEGRASKLVP
jgi:hypothetical protein